MQCMGVIYMEMVLEKLSETVTNKALFYFIFFSDENKNSEVTNKTDHHHYYIFMF